MEKLKISYPVIVEGKYDRLRLLSVIEGQVLTTDGFGIFKQKEKQALFAALADNAQVIIVDCTSSLSNPISAYAVKYADEVIRIAAPTLKSVSWQSSQLALYSDPIYKLERQHPGLNTPDGELYMPDEEARAHIPDIQFSIPYCRAVKQQMLDGQLWKSVKDKDFNRKFRALVEKVV